MLVALLLPLVLSATELSVSIAPGTACIERSSLETRLRAAGLSLNPGRSEHLHVELSQVGPQLEVVGSRAPGTAFRRLLPASDECAAVERVVAALIASWSRSLPSVKPPAAPPPAPVVRETPRPVEPAPASEPVAAPVPPARAEPAPPEAQLPPPPPPEPVVEVAATPVATPPTRSSVSLLVALGGGGALGPTLAVAPAGELGATLAFGRFGFGLDLGLEGSRRGELAPASVVSEMQWASLAGVARFRPADRLRVQASLGLRGFRFGALAAGVTEARPVTVLSFGGLARGELLVRLFGPWWAHLGVTGTVRWRAERFSVEGLGSVHELSPYALNVMIGLAFRGFGEP